MAPGRPDKWIRIPSAANIKASHKRTLSDMEETKQDTAPAQDKPLDPALLPEGDPDVDIESLIIPALQELHTAHIREAGTEGKENGEA